MIHLENGISLCGRCITGPHVGYITAIFTATYRIRWIDGNETEQLRPDDCDEEGLMEAAE